MNENSSEQAQEIERLLLRSKALDAPSPRARERALDAALRELRRTQKRRAIGAFAASTAALAVLIFGFVWWRGNGAAGEARPEAFSRTPSVPARASADAAGSSAASAASAKPTCKRLEVAAGTSPLIDDFEDRNARLNLVEGREGYWAVYNDGTGTQTPPGLSALHPERLGHAREDSHYALHTSGGAFTKWGSVIMAIFVNGGCYDASAYSGVEFWARGNTRIHVALPVIDEVEPKEGGFCQADDCYSGARKPVDLRKQWQKFRVSFDELRALSNRGKVVFDPTRVFSITFSIYREDTPFDVWIDDVRFSEKH